MAEQFYAAVNHSFHSAQYSTPIASLPNGPPLLSNSHVKQETAFIAQRHANKSGTNLTRPTKRQKTGGDQEHNSHKFVSQKKWKFSDAQPWLPSKTSSKAQNASKASTKYQRQVVSPKRSTSPQLALTSGNFDNLPSSNNRNVIQLVQQRSSSSDNTPSAAVVRDNALSRGGNRNDDNEAQSRPLRNSIEVLPIIPSGFSQVDNPLSERSIVRDCVSETEATKAGDESDTTSETPKPSRIPQTLSLEKDAARIAALIAEKRKENESSMFRERMLRKQFEHRTYKDNGRSVVTANAQAITDITDSRTSTSPFSDKDNTLSISENSPSTGASALSPDVNSASRLVHEIDGTQTHARIRKPEVQRTTSKKTKASRTDLNEEQATQTLSSVKKPPVISPIHSSSTMRTTNRAGKGHTSETPMDTSRTSLAQAQKHSSLYLEPHGRSAPFEAEDADVTAQLVALTNQFLRAKPIEQEQTTAETLSHQSHPMFFQKQPSSSITPVRNHTLQSSTGLVSNTLPKSRHVPTRLVRQPVITSTSQPPTSMPFRRNGPSEFLPSQHSPTRNTSRPVSGANPQTEPPSFQAMAYQTTNEQVFVASNHQCPVPDTHPRVAYPALAAQQSTANRSGTSMLLQQHLPQPRVLASNGHTFSGEVRTNNSNEVAPAAPKARVNMFGNTKGSPFPMHEVIRQIEMT